MPNGIPVAGLAVSFKRYYRTSRDWLEARITDSAQLNSGSPP